MKEIFICIMQDTLLSCKYLFFLQSNNRTDYFEASHRFAIDLYLQRCNILFVMIQRFAYVYRQHIHILSITTSAKQ